MNETIEEVKGEADPGLMGRLQSSTDDRNWDAVEDMWKMKEEIKEDEELQQAFEAGMASDVMSALESTERGQKFISERIEPHQQEFGYKAIWAHEFQYKTWKENPAPIIEGVRGYLESDYDYPSAIQQVKGRPRRGEARAYGKTFPKAKTKKSSRTPWISLCG